MFIYDKPIESEKDDFLGRKRFSEHLGKALLDWKEKESLVISLYGEWGSGKSSVINLAKECIEKSEHKNKPTIIDFNPWGFSEENNLGEHFFNEISKELALRKDTEKDKKIAKKLKYYASLLNLYPQETIFKGLSSKILIVLGVLGVSSSQIINWLRIPAGWIGVILFVGGVLLLLTQLVKDYLLKIAEFFELKADYYSKSVSEIKEEIKKDLIERNKKIVIVIDDIDRLNKSEIRQIFRLIRVNADFPNTVYLLAFERNIIEKNLEEQVGISGKDYLSKIVQVNFDVPFASPSKIESFLFQELDRILGILPEAAQKYFAQDDPYWPNVYHSGFKDFFKNIRDVKRFASSLEFNISLMHQGSIMEVNPIDFIAIEAIRIFVPEFYSFMRNKESLFTSTEREGRCGDDNPRKKEIENALSELPSEIKDLITKLIRRLFPQIDGVLQYGYSSHGEEWQSVWSGKLRVCATSNFNSYFTLIPGGNERELSQFEIENILNKTNSEEEFETILRTFINKGKIRKVLQRIQDYTSDQDRIPSENMKNVIGALFNISDDLPEEKTGMGDISTDMHIMRIIYQLLKRESDKNKNFNLLMYAIQSSKGLYGPVQKVSLESSRKEKEKSPDEFLVPEDKIGELQKLCVEKVHSKSIDDLLHHNKLFYILYYWKKWDIDENWKEFINKVIIDDVRMLLLMSKFIWEAKSQTSGDYGIKVERRFNYKNLSDFIDLSEAKTRLIEIKKINQQLYKENQETIDLFLDNFDKKDERG